MDSFGISINTESILRTVKIMNHSPTPLEYEYRRLCEECAKFHQLAIQANSSVRAEYEKHLDRLQDKKDEAEKRLKLLCESEEHLKEHMKNAAERAIAAFRSALSDAQKHMASARPLPPFSE